MPIVRVVTSAATGATHEGITALKNELEGELGWHGGGWSYHEYRANGAAGLPGAAKSAVDDKPPPQVIVTDGSLATDAVKSKTTTIPVIQAVGGFHYTGILNVRGFYIDTQATCQAQLNLVTTTDVFILCDTSQQSIYDSLTAPAGKTKHQVTTIGTINTITTPCTFMLVPNSDFFTKRPQIAHAVENKGVPAIYPEREYKQAYTGSTAGVTIYGHLVPFTFRQAAVLTDQILRGWVVLGGRNWPADMQEAVIDRDP